MGAFEAQYFGVCDSCGFGIHPGNMIRNEDGGKYRHDVCPEDEFSLPKRPLCKDCHTELPINGVCGYC